MCVRGRVAVCGCEWVGEIDEIRECVAKINECYDEIGELGCVCVCAGRRVCARVRVHVRACMGLEEDEWCVRVKGCVSGCVGV